MEYPDYCYPDADALGYAEDFSLATTLKIKTRTDEITKSISALFDYPFDGTSRFKTPDFPEIRKGFGIGLIVGPSGSGKSTLLRRFGRELSVSWQEDLSVASHFRDAAEAAEKFAAVGFNSIPSWLRPYHVLSTGEKFRADLSRRLSDGAVVDEFTSTIDRNVAKACAFAIRRYVDKKNLKNIVLASCHYDIIEWLQPDWVFDTNTGALAGRGSVPRPSIQLEVVPCSIEAWSLFRAHHYLDGNINRSSRCWLALWRDTPVGFSAALSFPNGNFTNAWREHRTVVLPDYQGLGIGVRLSDAVATLFKKNGARFFSKTAHPRLGSYRDSSPSWRATSKNKRNRKDYQSSRKTKEAGYRHKHVNRFCYSHEFIG